MLEEQLNITCERYKLDKLNIGANDLLPLFKNGTFTEVGKLIASVEHIGFYLQSGGGTGLDTPKRWAMKTLRLGYYAEPAGFQSWEERQAAAEIENARARLERLRRLADTQFDIDFEAWVVEMGPEGVKKRLEGSFVANPKSQAAIKILRGLFAEETGRRQPDFAAPEAISVNG